MKSAQVSIGTTAAQLDIASAGSASAVMVRNRGSVAIYLGGPDVTTANGYQLDAGEAVSISRSGAGADASRGVAQKQLNVWAVTASSTATTHVLQADR